MFRNGHSYLKVSALLIIAVAILFCACYCFDEWLQLETRRVDFLMKGCQVDGP